MKIKFKTREEVELIRESAQLVSRTLGLMAEEIDIGVSTAHLDNLAREFIRDHGGEPGFLGLYDFPKSLCISVNEQVVHGIPSENTIIQNGDIVSIDCGVLMKGYYGDHAYTFQVGQVEEATQALCRITEECLYKGIEACRNGNRIGDISFAIQEHAESHGYGVVRELVGHGLGKTMHEKPEVPNYGRRGKGPAIKEGLVIAIEPMINQGTRRVKQLNDKWTIVTADRKPSAHYEHDVAVVDGKAEVLSTFNYVEEALSKKDMVC